MKIVLKPRNHVAVQARFRKAGAHTKTRRAERSQGKQVLKKQMRQGQYD